MKTITQLGLILCLFLLYPYSAKSLDLPANLSVALSNGTGNWNSPSTWTWLVNNGNQQGPLTYPNDSTFVIIQTGHTVTLSSNSVCEGLVIEQGATLNNAVYELMIQFMGWAHSINDVGVDDGIPYFGYAPIDATWDINNPNNANWNIYKVDGTHTGSGNIIFDWDDGYDKAEFGATVSGSGSLTTTGSVYYRSSGGVSQGLKFNSACNLSFHGNLNLTDDEYPVNGGGALSSYNFGTINLMGNANFVTCAGGGTFNNTVQGIITIANGSHYLAPETALVAIFNNDGKVTIQNGNLIIPSDSFFMNNNEITINGNILGIDNSNPSCFFTQYAAGAILSITGEIFPATNVGTLTCYYVEPNYVIYNGTEAQNIIVPTEVYDPGTTTPYSRLIINNTAVATINASITVNDSLIIKPGAALTIANGVSLTSGSLTIQSNASQTGSLITDNQVSGNVMRYIAGHNGNNNDGWHLLSSPVDAQPISAFHTPGSGDDFYKWDETTNTWINRTDIGGGLNTSFETNFGIGTGYLVANAITGTKVFTGLFNVADVPLSNLSNTGGNSYAGWHLLGNPFSSAIVWNNGDWALNNIDANAQIWNEANASYSVIATNDVIPSTNGFMVHAGFANASLTIPASARVHDNTAWYKNSEQVDRIVLHAIDTEGGTIQPSIIRFDANASVGYDSEYDSYFLAGFAPNFYSISQNENYALNTIPELTTIPMGFVKNDGNQFYIELMESIPGQTVYLTDLKTNQTINLNDADYTFESMQEDEAKRFLLHFSTLGIDAPEIEQEISVWVYDNRLFFRNQEPGNISVYDLQGRLLNNYQVNSSGLQSVPINLSSGIYLVRMHEKSSMKSVKIIIP